VPSGTALVAFLGSFRALGGPASSAGWRAGALRAGVALPIAGADRARRASAGDVWPHERMPGPPAVRARCLVGLDVLRSLGALPNADALRVLVLGGPWCSAGFGARRASVLGGSRCSCGSRLPGRLSRGSRSGAPRIPPSGSTVRLATGLLCHRCLSGRRVCLITGLVWPQGLSAGSRGVPSHRLRVAEGTSVGGGSPVSATGAPLNACRGGQRRAHPLSSMRTGWSGRGRPVWLRVAVWLAVRRRAGRAPSGWPCAVGLAVRRRAGRVRRLRRRRAPGSTR
jgi:hypothetical protein